jgi:uncharacterized phosphosugar-binding protein
VRDALAELDEQQVIRAAEFVADALRHEGIVHIFGAGHSALLAQEVFFRAGGLVAVRPILDRRIQFADGAIESTEFERQPGAAEELAVAAGFRPVDVGIVISNSGRNVLPVQMALEMRSAGMKVIALTNLAQSEAGKSLHRSGKRLFECADAVLDNHCPTGDAAFSIRGTKHSMGPVSTIAGAALLHAVFLEAATQLAAEGKPPAIFQSANVGDGSLERLRLLVAPYEGRIEYYRQR